MHVACGRCEKTFTNYLGYARVGCLLVGAPDEIFNSKALQRAKRAIAKRQSFIPPAAGVVRSGQAAVETDDHVDAYSICLPLEVWRLFSAVVTSVIARACEQGAIRVPTVSCV